MKTARMPVFFGCTGNNTEATIANVRFAKDNGADGAILAAPAYICAPEDDIERFFLEVADATDLPLGIYNNPPRVKSDLHWDHRCASSGIRTTSCTRNRPRASGQVAQVLAGEPKVSVMCCDSPNLGLVVPTMSLGGHGTANMTGNVAPRARNDLDALEKLRRGGEFQDRLSQPAAPALHLFRDQPGGGEVADEGARAARGRSAQAPDQSRGRGVGQGHPRRAGARARQAIRLQDRPDLRRRRVRWSWNPRPKALLSGASRGLGRACAIALAQEGVDVTIVARKRDALENRRGDRGGDRRQVATVAGDITTAQDALPRGLPRARYPAQQCGRPAAGRFPRLVAGRLDRRARRHDAVTHRDDAAHRRRHDGPRLRPYRQHRLAQREDPSGGARPVERRALRTRRLRRRPCPPDRLPQRHHQQSAAGHLRQRRAARVDAMLASSGKSFDELWHARAANPAKRYGRPAELGAYCAFLCSSTPASSPGKIC